MNQLQPKPTAEMQALWNKAMLLARTRGAYGVAFPMPGATYPLPQPGTMLFDILFACTASEAGFEDHLAAVREDMIAWKARVAASGGKRRESIVRDVNVEALGLDLSKMEFKL